MRDVAESLRRWTEIVGQTCAQKAGYYEQMPLLRLLDQLIEQADILVERGTTGRGSIQEVAAEVSFVAMAIAARSGEARSLSGPNISESRQDG